MDFAQLLNILVRLRVFVVLAAIVALLGGLSTRYTLTSDPVGLQRDVERSATATTQLLLDSPQSPLTDASLDIAPLSARASLYAAFMLNDEARAPILQKAGLPPTAPVLFASAAPTESTTSADTAPSGAPEGQRLLIFRAQEGLPLITIRANAPGREEAARLANGAARGAQEYLATLKPEGNLAPQTPISVRQLGRAEGLVLEQGTSVRAVIVAVIGLFAVLCLLILLVDASIRGIRLSRAHAARSEI